MLHNMTQTTFFLYIISTMDRLPIGLPKDDNHPNYQRGLELFNDNDLPSCLRSSCLALLTEQEIRSHPLTSVCNPSPNKKRLLEQVSHINALHAISSPQKQSVVGKLTQAYFESKHNLESSFGIPDSNIKPTIINRNNSLSLNEQTSHVVVRSCDTRSIQPDPRTRRISQVWLNLPHVQYERLGDAMSALGPTITQIKKTMRMIYLYQSTGAN